MPDTPELPPTDQLAPCPFCGGEARPNTVRYSPAHVKSQGWAQDTYHAINCIQCGADNRGIVGHKTQADAIAAWNRRATRLAAAPQGWPAGLLDRVKAAAQRVQNNECPRRIPADPTDVDLVLAEVQALLERRKPPFWLTPAPDAAPAASSPEAQLVEALQAIADCCDEEHGVRDYASRQYEIRNIARVALRAANGEAQS